MQHTHSLLEMVPFCVSCAAICTHWDQFQALLGRGKERPRFEIKLRQPAMPPRPIALTCAAVALLGALPHADEFRRCLRQRDRAGRDTPECARELFS